VPLPRERAKKPYSAAEIAGYLALADAQPATARRMRAAGLVCLGAGAGLIRADLRAVRGTDVPAPERPPTVHAASLGYVWPTRGYLSMRLTSDVSRTTSPGSTAAAPSWRTVARTRSPRRT
jgi:hypothetical protein